ncbi:MAG: DUF3631 domain-containing protein [Actinophytocola sp.]|uniref:DUF3631 domain-containing protein n=1 Tax=Actinophytocola sp. TaxID=1872138 RepID=UPI0013287B2A|nr:DUF3631 domain-containing protein [Actinophytocola sp.]MPZ83175.1 DUF3631 domain-containing protein [Actinophytocola sp.]
MGRQNQPGGGDRWSGSLSALDHSRSKRRRAYAGREPLVALADEAGGHWPDTARAACAHFVLNASEPATDGVRLLADLRTVFRHHNTDRLPTKALLADLVAMEEAPCGGCPAVGDMRRGDGGSGERSEHRSERQT